MENPPAAPVAAPSKAPASRRRRAGALARRDLEDRALAAEFRRGGLTAGLAALVVFGHVPLWLRHVFWGAHRALRGALPVGVGHFALLTAAFLAPVAAAGVLYLATRRALDRAAARSEDHGRAAAAGAGMALTATALAVIGWGHWYVGRPELLEILSQVLATGLGVGVYGSLAFGRVRRVAPDASGRELPALYQGMRAAGLAVPAHFAVGVAWAAAAAAVPALGVAALLPPLVTALPAVMPSFWLLALAFAAALPASAATGWWLRRAEPGGSRRVLLAGVLAPLAVPLLGAASLLLSGYYGVAVGPNLAFLGVVGAGALLAHGTAAGTGIALADRARRGARALPGAAGAAGSSGEVGPSRPPK